MKGLDVICPGCKNIFHETTDTFDPYHPARGDMVYLKDPWRKWGWCSFGDAGNGLPPNIAERPGTYWSAMECPGCGAPLAPSGRLTVRHPDGSEFTPAPKPEPVCNVVDGRLVFNTDYSELESEWEGRSTTEESRDEKIVRLRNEGLSYAKVGAEVGLSAEMVRRICMKADGNG